jgi:hypothetical protein
VSDAAARIAAALEGRYRIERQLGKGGGRGMATERELPRPLPA